jgi:hypothetical protein
MIAEKHVAVIDLTVDGYDIYNANAAFAALAIRHHLVPCFVERIEHGVSSRNCHHGDAAVRKSRE